MSFNVMTGSPWGLGVSFIPFFSFSPPPRILYIKKKKEKKIHSAFPPREEISTKKSDEAGEMPPTLDSEQGPAGVAGPSEPPAPPPSPAEDCRV